MATSRRIRVVVSSLDQFIDRLLRKLILEVVAELVRAPSEGGTPVATGWARANWIPRIGGPAQGTAGTQEAARAGDISVGPQQAGIAAVATSYKAKQGAAHITNNVPYIVRLNEGHSGQAASGFVQAAIARAIRNTVVGAA